MAEPQIAAHTPVACAGCFAQYPERVHVDFRSAIDGPQVSDNPRAPRVEWVVMCEGCIRAAYELLPEQAGQRDQLERQVAQLTERAEAAEQYASRLEDAFSHKPKTDVETPAREPRAPRPSKPHPKRKGASKSRPATAARRNRYQRTAA